MCGISGFLAHGESSGLIDKLIQMNNLVSHRGPDGEGFFIDSFSDKFLYLGDDSNKKLKQLDVKSGVFLGHRRLSIIDLSDDGLQPFQRNNNYLIFNGEIYNYLEIKDELIAKGYTFKTKTDTEVILTAYEEWGQECVSRFNGMWAFAVYDSLKNLLFLSRDRFGIKPLYYYQDSKNFIFSSEIKQILSFGIPRIVNNKTLDNFLLFELTDTTNETFFKGVYSLRPSHSMVVKILDSRFEILEKMFYSPLEESYYRNEEETIELVKETFLDSVKLRLRSDVEVGSCLSGGLDSSSIVAIASELHHKESPSKKFKTFTTTHNDPSVDETRFSKVVNQHTNTQGHFAKLDDSDFLDAIKKVVYHQEEPFSSFSIYSSWKVMELASKEKISVLLDGQGGDELFLGYEIYYTNYINYLIRRAKFFKLIKLFTTVKQRSKLNSFQLFKYWVYFSFPNLRGMVKKIKIKSLMNSEYKISISSPINDFTRSENFKDLFHNNFYSRIQHLLKYEDRNSMAFSIETRLPFMDYRLFEIMMNTNPELIFDDGWLKSILRKVGKDRLPNEILYRRVKYGFHAPEKELLHKFMRNELEILLSQSQMMDLFNVKDIMALYDGKTEIQLLVKVLVLGLWFKEFNPVFQS